MLEDRVVVTALVLDFDVDDLARLDIEELLGTDEDRGAPVGERGLHAPENNLLRTVVTAHHLLLDQDDLGDREADSLEAQARGLQLADRIGRDRSLEITVSIHLLALELRPVAPVLVLEDRVVVTALVGHIDADDVAFLDVDKVLGTDEDRGAPVGERRFLAPDGGLHGLPVAFVATVAFDPDLFEAIELEQGVAAAREEQVPVVQGLHQRIVAEGDLEGTRPVVVRNELVGHVVRREVVVRTLPLDGPVAVGDADLEPVRVQLEGRVERAVLDDVPDLLRELGDALIVAVVALEGEAVRTVPVGRAVTRGIVIGPVNLLDGLPVTAAARFVVQFREGNLFPVEGVELADPGPFQDAVRDVEDHGARALAVEGLVLEDERVALVVEQFGAADELEVRTEDGQLLAAGEVLAVLLGEAGDDGVAQGQVLLGFRLVVRGTDDELAAGGGDAGRGGQADHAVPDMLDVGDAHPAGEDDLADARQAGPVHGHRLAGDDLRREEHLDMQAGGVHRIDFPGSTCCGEAQEGDGQHHSDMLE